MLFEEIIAVCCESHRNPYAQNTTLQFVNDSWNIQADSKIWYSVSQIVVHGPRVVHIVTPGGPQIV
jgi:hypothetical protein